MHASFLRTASGVAAAALLTTVLAVQPASAATSANLTYTSSDDGHGVFTYDLQLANTGTTPIKTLWFSWIPFASFLPSVPSGVTSAPTWSGQVVSDFYGNSILWDTADANGLAPGNTATGFSFTSPDSPAVLAGLDHYFGYYPIGTSYVYSGTVSTPADPLPTSFAVIQAAPAAAPEPATAAALLGVGLIARVRRRRR